MLSEIIRKPIVPFIALGVVAAVVFTIIGIQALPSHENDETVSAESFIGHWVDGENPESGQELTIDSDYSAYGSDGCNGIMSTWSYNASRESVQFKGFAGTLMACLDDDGKMIDGWLRGAGEVGFDDPTNKDSLTVYDSAGNRIGSLERD